MQNINTTRQTILENVNLGTIIENFEPISMQGTALKKSLVESLNDKKLFTITALTDVIVECNALRHIDSNAFVVAESVTNAIKDSMKAKIVYCFETLGTRQNSLTENLKAKLEQLVILEDAEIINSIRSGSLMPYRSIGAVNFLIESVKLDTDESSTSAMHEAYHPVSYYEINEADTTFVRLHNRVIGMKENLIFEANSPSPKFSFMSSIVESMTWSPDSEAFLVEHAELGTFTVSENMITRKAKGSDEIVESSDAKAFVSELSMIVEAKANNSISRNVLNEQKHFIDAIVAIKENINHIALTDNIVIVETKASGDKFALIVNENVGGAAVCTLKSNRLPNILEQFGDIRNALKVLESKSGFNATSFVTDKLQVLESADAQKVSNANAMKSVVEALIAKETSIIAMITEAKAETNRNTGKIEKLNEALSVTRGLINEQNNKLAQILS